MRSLDKEEEFLFDIESYLILCSIVSKNKEVSRETKDCSLEFINDKMRKLVISKYLESNRKKEASGCF